MHLMIVILLIFKCFRLLYNIVVMYTKLYIKYYFRLLYIIWKLHIHEWNLSFYFSLALHDKFLTSQLLISLGKNPGDATCVKLHKQT